MSLTITETFLASTRHEDGLMLYRTIDPAIIVGAGIVGLAAAGELAGGWAIDILEQSSPCPREDGYIVDLGFHTAAYTFDDAEVNRQV